MRLATGNSKRGVNGGVLGELWAGLCKDGGRGKLGPLSLGAVGWQ